MLSLQPQNNHNLNACFIEKGLREFDMQTCGSSENHLVLDKPLLANAVKCYKLVKTAESKSLLSVTLLNKKYLQCDATSSIQMLTESSSYTAWSPNLSW